MNRNPKESDIPEKQEAHSSDHAKAKASSCSSSAQWLRWKDPRIVRASRAFGGKDRHSKVCTIRGLRDRRVRLSVPTAIQLYDLQDRLGLNQPSKVVDWLLNAAKNEIDELPPLPIPPAGNFTLSPYPSAVKNAASTVHWENKSGNTSWKYSKSKDVSGEMMISQKENCTRRSEEINESHGAQELLPNNVLQRANHHPSLFGLLNRIPFGYQWENSVNESQSGNHGLTSQTDLHSINAVPFPSTLVCPLGARQSYFPSHVTAMDIDQRQINHYQILSSNSQNLLTNSLSPSMYPVSQSVKPFSLSMVPTNLLHPPNHSESQSHKDRNFASK